MLVEDKYTQTISVVYPAVAPSDAYNIPTDRTIKSHVTISILGEIPEVTFRKEDLLAKLRNVSWEPVTEALVKQLALFGIDNNFLVLQLESPAFQMNWHSLNEALHEMGISSVDKYPEYHPHLTLKHDYTGSLPTPDSLPHVVKVGCPTLWWGKESIQLI